MSDPTSRRLDTSDHLGRVGGTSALALLVLIILLVVLERTGVAKETIAQLLLLGALALYAGVGLTWSTADRALYRVAGRGISAVFAGVAGGAEWTSAAIVLGAAGSLFLGSYDGRTLLIGLTGGYVLLAALVAPFLRSLEVYTVPDFLAVRYGGGARLLAVLVLVVCSSMFLVAVVQAAVPIASQVLGVNEDVALALVLAVSLFCALPGGAHAAAATQVGQYVALVIGCLALFLMVEAQRFDAPSGATYDPVLEALEAIVRGLGLAPAQSPRSVPFRLPDAVNNLEFVACLMAGTASLPHILMRPLTTPDTGHARKSAAWSLLFIAILVFVLPTYVAVSSADASREQSGVVTGLVATIGLTAMVAAASGLLLVVANSIDHDAIKRLFAREDSSSGGPIIAGIVLAAVAALAAYLVKTMPAEPLSWMAWSFSLAAAGFFPALVLGIWWPRTTTAGAICGITAGFGLCLFYIVVSRYFPQMGVTRFGMSSLLDPENAQPLVNVAQVLADPRWLTEVPASTTNPLVSKIGWFNIGNLAAGVLGLAVGFAITIIVSLLRRMPSARTQAVVDSLHTPRS